MASSKWPKRIGWFPPLGPSAPGGAKGTPRLTNQTLDFSGKSSPRPGRTWLPSRQLGQLRESRGGPGSPAAPGEAGRGFAGLPISGRTLVGPRSTGSRHGGVPPLGKSPADLLAAVLVWTAAVEASGRSVAGPAIQPARLGGNGSKGTQAPDRSSTWALGLP